MKTSQMAHFLHFFHQLIKLYPLVFFISLFQDIFWGFLLWRKDALGTRLKIEWYLNDLFKLLKPNETFFSSYLLFNSGYLVVTSGYLNATTSYCSYL